MRWAPFAEPEALVDQLYRDTLGRQPSPGELAAAAAPLRAGVADGADLASGLVASNHYVGVVEPVIRLYLAAFERFPDDGGLSFWLATRRGGATLADVAASFAGSTEFADRYAGLDEAGYVDALYRHVFERPSDPGGSAHWTDLLRHGWTRAQVLMQLTESAEYRARLGNHPLVAATYFGLLGRVPEPHAHWTWVVALDAGAPPRQLVAAILESPEYARRVLAG